MRGGEGPHMRIVRKKSEGRAAPPYRGWKRRWNTDCGRSQTHIAILRGKWPLPVLLWLFATAQQTCLSFANCPLPVSTTLLGRTGRERSTARPVFVVHHVKSGPVFCSYVFYMALKAIMASKLVLAQSDLLTFCDVDAFFVSARKSCVFVRLKNPQKSIKELSE